MIERTTWETLLLATTLAITAIGVGAIFCFLVSKVIRFIMNRREQRNYNQQVDQ